MHFEQLETAARAAEREGKWDDAYTLWAKSSGLAALSVHQIYAFARSAAYSGRLDQADSLLNGIENSPVPKAQFAMLKADIAERRRDYASALQWRSQAARLQPDSYWAHFGMARAKGALKYPADEILADMKAAILMPGVEKQGALYAASLLFRAGEFDAAGELADRFLGTAEEREVWRLKALPGMTSERERLTARELARTLKGKGKIVDLGCWLGSLTAALASGLAANTSKSKPEKVIAYDKFAWESIYMEASWPGSRVGLKDGDDYLPWFRKLTAPWAALIDARKADLETAAWKEGPIGLLIVDAMKTAELGRRIMAAFYPSLQKNALLFHQDFCHDHTWWIHLFQYQARHKFTVADTIPGSFTVVFQLTQPFSNDEMKALLATDVTDPDLAEKAFAYSLSIVDPIDRPAVLKAYIRCETLNKRPERAAEIKARLNA